MKKVVFQVPGRPSEILHVEEVDKPQAAADEVVIKVIASPINPSDMMFVQDLYGIRPQLPSGAGFEGVGVVESVGQNAKIAVGTRVAFTGVGVWAEYAVAASRTLMPVPDAMPDEVAAQLFVNPFTAVAMVEETGVKPGEWLMVTAVGSALGKMVVQLCQMRGIKIVGTVRRDDLNDDLRKLGIDEVINTETESMAERVKQITGGKGVRAVLECVGGTTTTQAVECLGRGGTMLIYGLMSMQDPRISIGAMIFKELTIKGFWLTDWIRRVDSQVRTRVATEVITLLATGKIQLPVEASYNLDDIKKATAHAEAQGRWGKILIKP